ncbi:CGNR zinc finger domain-containing protein [Naasia aerilata]|uniref:Zinc finger CGNR domain-containing protein n=1 Tax=Naasia aerilata TaxID=1162966 RepID=A0ABM8GEV4_9MICO|nr:CGNR zinc finger domain-containing protein [Naasia aerilata]BDZ46863.1 hypothetical protein GCM10025866_27720 [Naasia aerilata]
MTSWTTSPVQPGGRAPAPGRLALVQSFVNTIDLEDGTESDEFSTLDGLTAWADRAGVVAPPSLTDEDRELAVRLREDIRRLAREHSGLENAEPAEDRLERDLRELRLTATVEQGRIALAGASPLGSLLAPMIDALRTGMDDGTWSRLKVCHRDTCQWLFYDSSRNQASHWCATSICGSREKAKRAYARRTGRASG